MKLRIRPKSDYLHKASLNELHRINLQWESEIKLRREELNFFQGLIDKYIMKILHESTLVEVQQLVDRINLYYDEDMDEIMEKVQEHEQYLESLLEDPFSLDEAKFRNEHSQLEDEITSFMENFKIFKLEIFKVIDGVLKDQKFQNTLTP